MSRSSPRVLGQRTCRGCGVRKGLAAFPEGGRRCTACLEDDVPTLTKNQRNRARNRAYIALAHRHKEEYDALYRQETDLMRNANGIAAMLKEMH